MTASEKAHMLRCASSFVVATYGTVRLTPHDSRALPLELFYEAARLHCDADLLRVCQ
jgi:hypothetical protein